jgi:hypothetical protein
MIKFLIGMLVYSLLAGIYYRITCAVFKAPDYEPRGSYSRLMSSYDYPDYDIYNIVTSIIFPLFMWVLIAKVGGEIIFKYIKGKVSK